MMIYPVWEAQIALLLAKELIVLAEYSDFADVFSKKLVEVLSERIKIIKHAIELEDGKQSPYRPIYNLSSMELETLKTYIKTNLVQNFIWPLKSPIGVLILFVHKLDGSLQLCINLG